MESAQEIFLRQQEMCRKMMSLTTLPSDFPTPKIEIEPAPPPRDRHAFLLGEINHVSTNRRLGRMSSIDSDSNYEGTNTAINNQKLQRSLELFDTYPWEEDLDMTSLSIFRYRERILSKIEESPVTIISGSTGCGKSTGVPKFLLDHAREKHRPCNILITQPRRIAAKSLARHVSSTRHWKLGTIVGYQVGLDKQLGSDTIVQYVTTGILLERLVGGRPLSEYSHVIVDECHERDTDLDLLFFFIRCELQKNGMPTKVILMSATANVQKLSEYFYENIPLPPNGPFLNVDQRMFQVQSHFLDDLCSNHPQALINDAEKADLFSEVHESGVESTEDITQTHAISVAKKKLLYRLLCFIQEMELSQQAMHSTELMKCGTVLVFLPGLWDILDVRDFLRTFSPDQRDLRYKGAFLGQRASGSPHIVSTWTIIPLHSQINSEDQDLVFSPPHVGKRKIILATNIAESSITIPDVKYVMDFAMTKQLKYQPETTFTVLLTVWTSRSSCEQRRGRAGRVQEGDYFCFITNKKYNELMLEEVPETQRIPLEHVVLKVKKADQEPKDTLTKMIDPPEIPQIGQSLLNLSEMGAIAVERNMNVTLPTQNTAPVRPRNMFFKAKEPENGGVGCINMMSIRHKGPLTLIGELMCSLPLDLHASKLIALGYAMGILDETVIIACCMCAIHNVFVSVPTVISKEDKLRGLNSLPPRTDSNHVPRYLEAYEKKLRFSGRSNSDAIAMLNAFCTWQQKKARAFRSESEEMQWCQRHYLDWRTLREVESRVNEVRARLVQDFSLPMKEADEMYNLMTHRAVPTHGDVLNKEHERLFLIQVAIAGAFYPNFFLRQYETTVEVNTERDLLSHDPQRSVSIRGLPQGQGSAYMKPLSDWFNRQCLSGVMTSGENTCEVIPYESQAIIVFPKDKKMESLDLPRGATLAVYLAMQMGRLNRLTPSLPRLKHDSLHPIVQQKISELNKLVRNSDERHHLDVPVQVLTNHIGVPKDAVKQMDVVIITVIDVGVLGAICVDHLSNYQQIRQNIQQIYPTLPSVTKPAIGMLCVVDSHRVRVVNVDNSFTEVMALFVDIGDIRPVPIAALRLLEDEELQQFPEMGLRLVLANLQPETLSHPDGVWLDEDRRRFTNILKDKQSQENPYWRCEVYSVVGRDVRVFLYPPGCQLPLDSSASVNVEMTKMPHFAEHSLEPLMSELSHQDREKTLIANLDPAKKFVNTFKEINVCPSSEVSKRASELTQMLTQCQGIGQSSCNMVRGPHHPLLMSFYGVCKSTIGKQPIIASDSVNSVIIDDHPSSHTDRLLVAGLVQQNPRNVNKLVLRHTTLLPHIHGLPMLMALLFSPFAELRVDQMIGDQGSERTAYRGVCAGLGYDTELRPNNEESTMEINADVLLDKKDLYLINEVRCGLSVAFQSIRTDRMQTETMIRPLIQDNLLQLFSKQRDYVHINVMNPQKRCVWRHVAPEHYSDLELAHNVVSLTYPPHYQVKDVANDSALWSQTNRWPESPEEANWRARFAQRLRSVTADLNSMACRNTTSSRQNNTLSMVGVCESCGVVLRDRLHIVSHLDTEGGQHECTFMDRVNKLQRKFQ